MVRTHYFLLPDKELAHLRGAGLSDKEIEDYLLRMLKQTIKIELGWAENVALREVIVTSRLP